MNRLEATQIVVDHAGDAAIVASLGHPAYDLFAAGDRPRNFYTWGSMGLASSVGLGLALARPDVRVFVLEGDGSLLMNLGSLATIGLLQPANFVLIVMDNEQFATTYRFWFETLYKDKYFYMGEADLAHKVLAVVERVEHRN